MEHNIVDLSDVHKIGRLVVGRVYHVYERQTSSFGFKKYMSLFGPEESNTGTSFVMSVRYLSDDKFELITGDGQT